MVKSNIGNFDALVKSLSFPRRRESRSVWLFKNPGFPIGVGNDKAAAEFGGIK